MSSGLAVVIGSVLPEFFSQLGVPGSLAFVAAEIAKAFVAGQDLSPVWPLVLTQLRENVAVISGLKTTVATILDLVNTTLLSIPSIQQALGSTITTVITELAGSADVRAFIGDQLGPTVGTAVVGLLANSAAVQVLATVLGSTVTHFLAYTGFTTSLIDAADQFADAVLDGSEVSAALQSAWAALQANPDFLAAVKAIIPVSVRSILGDADVRLAAGVAAQIIVVNLLKENGITSPFLDGAAGQVTKMTVMSLLAKAAIAKLAYTIVVDLLGGMPLSQVKDVAIHALLREPDVQIAVGMSVGQGVGSLFGDNIFGAVIGTTTGITLSLMLGVVGALSGLFMNHQGSAGAGSGGFARVAITHMTIGSPTQPTSIDVGVRVQSDTAEALLVDLTFRLESLLGMQPSVSVEQVA
ncbi:hypothetical protein H7J51_18250 [Mycobacterium crocinum]|nr:hypothetical protein [Mycolicibacterium crocinum]MCV7217217.1 hypothetical protein [Mycolicibacterium crocinum]